MSTHAGLIVTTPNGKFAPAYIHFDGYPSGVGAKLRQHYTTPEKVADLMAKGDMSALGETVERTQYYVDRGEDPKDIGYREYETSEDAMNDLEDRGGNEYVYFWNHVEWFLRHAGTLLPLNSMDLADY